MIYLDYNATTPLCQPARDAMRPYLETHFGNPSSVHSAGREARAAIDDARDQLAAILGARPHELIFTATGTESNNLAILGLARSRSDRGKHLICASTEHHAVLHAFQFLEKRENFAVTYLPVDSAGRVEVERLAASFRSDTTLVSVMSANNETGVIQTVGEMAELCATRDISFHSDMVQSFAKLPTDLTGGAIAAASFAAHKFHGPKGAGLLFLRAGLPIDSIQFGGSHENQRRPGTENVAAIAGMAAAAEWSLRDRAQEQAREEILRDRLWSRIERTFPNAVLNGDGAPRLANALNVSFPGQSSETLLMALDLEGVCASSGSACMVGSVVASHVLLAMGAPPEIATSALRFSLGHETTKQEIDAAGDAIERVIARLGCRRAKGAAGSHALA